MVSCLVGCFRGVCTLAICWPMMAANEERFVEEGESSADQLALLPYITVQGLGNSERSRRRGYYRSVRTEPSPTQASLHRCRGKYYAELATEFRYPIIFLSIPLYIQSHHFLADPPAIRRKYRIVVLSFTLTLLFFCFVRSLLQSRMCI